MMTIKMNKQTVPFRNHERKALKIMVPSNVLNFNTFPLTSVILLCVLCCSKVISQWKGIGRNSTTTYGRTTGHQETLKNSIQQKNVYGNPLEICSLDPLTGFFRDGYSRTGDRDHGSHTICARMTQEFLQFTKARGNDLSMPQGRSFPGLRPGDYWSICAVRWLEAFKVDKSPPVKLAATNEAALNVIPLYILEDKADDAVTHDEL